MGLGKLGAGQVWGVKEWRRSLEQAQSGMQRSAGQ